MNDREWQKQELEAMERLALGTADRARWDSLDAKGLLPSRVARKLSGLKDLATSEDPLKDYDVQASAAFRAPFDAGPEEAEAERITPAPEADKTAGAEGRRPLLRRVRRPQRLFRR